MQEKIENFDNADKLRNCSDLIGQIRILLEDCTGDRFINANAPRQVFHTKVIVNFSLKLIQRINQIINFVGCIHSSDWNAFKVSKEAVQHREG